MVEITTLWLPILVSAVGVFVVSSVVHMVLPIHKSDMGQVPGESTVLEAMRAQGLKPGSYRFPYCVSMQEMNTDEFRALLDTGPVGTMTIVPSGPMKMGKSLVLWFIYSLVVGVFVAYITGLGRAPGAEFVKVFQTAGAVAFLGYGLSSAQDSIWKGVSWGVTAKFAFDGLLYGLTTGAIFAAMWPGPVA